jgi:hydrogenase-1 operon protein HyaF
MATYRPPPLPESEDLAGRVGASRVLRQTLGALRQALAGETPAPIRLHGLAPADRQLVNQVLGEGEVSARVLPTPGQDAVQAQESVFAGVWRVLRTGAGGGFDDHIEVAPLPRVLVDTAIADAAQARPEPMAAPADVFNVQPVLVELEHARRSWRPGQPAHVVNLTLLPMTAVDIACLDHALGTGRVLILSRGYGNCRITNTGVAHTWRIVYYNSQDTVILNAVEVIGVPEVACAAADDLHDSCERLAEVLAWVERG